MKLPLFFLVFLVVVITCPVSALHLSSSTVDPWGPVTPGTPVTANFEIDATNFLLRDDLQFFTQLENQTWTYTIIVGGIESPKPSQGGRVFTIPGSELGSVGYESPYEKVPAPTVSVRCTLTGTAPGVKQTTSKILFLVQVLDSYSRCLTTPRIERTVIVIAQDTVPTPFPAKLSDAVTPVTPAPAMGNTGNISPGTRSTERTPVKSENRWSEEQDKKQADQNSSLDQIIQMFKNFFGMTS